MKKYLIKSDHNIYVDDFNEGELEYINFYATEDFVKAENARDAIKKYFESSLYFSFDPNNLFKSEDYIHKGFYSILVDEDNNEASNSDISLWREGLKKLYSDNITIETYELKPVDINF
jgi:hypothetical protein